MKTFFYSDVVIYNDKRARNKEDYVFIARAVRFTEDVNDSKCSLTFHCSSCRDDDEFSAFTFSADRAFQVIAHTLTLMSNVAVYNILVDEVAENNLAKIHASVHTFRLRFVV